MPLDSISAHQPGMLWAQPPSLDTPPPSNADWPQIYAHLESRRNALRNWRHSWWQHWSLLAQFILPHRYHWVTTANSMGRGHPVNESIIDETATLAMRICASGMLAGLMSPSRPWFQLGVGLDIEPDSDGKEWLEDTTKRIYAVLAGSNFYTESAQLFQDVATFGTSPMVIYEDHEDVIRCYVPCAGEYYLGVGARFSVDTLYREFTYTVAQIVDWFGLERCPEEVRKLWYQGGGHLETEFVIAHAIEPNFPLARGQQGKIDVLPKSMPWREVYWLAGKPNAAELSRKGYPERPFMAARWSKTSNDAYGRSPGMDALGGTMQLQQETRRKGEYIDKGVRPPMGADPALQNQPTSILPGEITFINTQTGGGKGFWPLYEPSPQWLPALSEDIQQVQQRINRAFFTDVFLMITQMDGVQPRNEMEIVERKGEKIQMLGPVIELFETEFASPAITRVMGIMARRRLLRPMPRSLQGLPIELQYVSMMKMAQRAAETVGIERTLAVAANLTEGAMAAGLPPPLRILNLDQTLRDYASKMGFPAKAILSPDEIKEHDQAQAQKAAADQMAQMALPAVQAAHGLSEIDVGGGQSALGAMLGTSASPGQQ